MSLYNPPSGNNVSFELKTYTVPSGNNVNFELLPQGIEVETFKVTISYPNVTLKGSLSGLNSGESANVWFEYRTIGSTAWNTTSQQTLYEDGEFSDAISLSDGDYEYRAVAQKIVSGSSEVKGNIVNFYLNTYAESLTMGEISNYKFSFLKDESLSLLEDKKVAIIKSLILEDALTLEDTKKFSYCYDGRDSFSLKERKKFKWFTFFREKISFNDLQKSAEKNPINYWIIAKPINTNFSFDEDTNNDGLGDNWESSSTNMEIIQDETRLSVQEVELFSDDYLRTTMNLAGKYFVLFEVKPLFRISFYIKKGSEILYHYTFEALDEWRLFLLDFSFNGSYTFEFRADDYSYFYLDNFAIIDYKDYLKVVEHFRPAPSEFSYKVSGDEIINAFEEQFSQKKVNSDFTINFEHMDYDYEKYFNNLIGQKILVKTNLNEVFSFLVLGLNKNYKPNKQGINQTYITRLLVKEV